MAVGDYATLNDVQMYTVLGQKSDGTYTTTRDDPLAEQMITSMSRIIDTYCDWRRGFYNEIFTNALVTGTYVRVDNNGFIHLLMDKPTIQSVTAVAYKLNFTDTFTTIDPKYAIFQALDATQQPTEESDQIIISNEAVDLTPWRNTRLYFQVSYSGGYTTIPVAINEGCRELVSYAYNLRQAQPTGSVGFFFQGGQTIRPLDIPPFIKQILDPWRRVSI